MIGPAWNLVPTVPVPNVSSSVFIAPSRGRTVLPMAPSWVFLLLIGQILPVAAAPEPLGQSSRRTSLVISEIMYHPQARSDGKALEFVELFNSLSIPQDVSGWRLGGDADFIFPPNTVVHGRGFLVVAQSPDDLTAVYGLTGVFGPLSKNG